MADVASHRADARLRVCRRVEHSILGMLVLALRVRWGMTLVLIVSVQMMHAVHLRICMRIQGMLMHGHAEGLVHLGVVLMVHPWRIRIGVPVGGTMCIWVLMRVNMRVLELLVLYLLLARSEVAHERRIGALLHIGRRIDHRYTAMCDLRLMVALSLMVVVDLDGRRVMGCGGRHLLTYIRRVLRRPRDR